MTDFHLMFGVRVEPNGFHAQFQVRLAQVSANDRANVSIANIVVFVEAGLQNNLCESYIIIIVLTNHDY
jgi:hypothetical protein